MNKNVAIIDYGLGNILSAQQSFLKVANENNLKSNVIITNKSEDIAKSISDKSVVVTGPAGSVTFHHVRLLHGSKMNTLIDLVMFDIYPVLIVFNTSDFSLFHEGISSQNCQIQDFKNCQ